MIPEDKWIRFFGTHCTKESTDGKYQKIFIKDIKTFLKENGVELPDEKVIKVEDLEEFMESFNLVFYQQLGRMYNVLKGDYKKLNEKSFEIPEVKNED